MDVLCRTGFCSGMQAGQCKHVHDPAKVAVCVRWLQGSCKDGMCLLQHQVSRAGSNNHYMVDVRSITATTDACTATTASQFTLLRCLLCSHTGFPGPHACVHILPQGEPLLRRICPPAEGGGEGLVLLL